MLHMEVLLERGLKIVRSNFKVAHGYSALTAVWPRDLLALLDDALHVEECNQAVSWCMMTWLQAAATRAWDASGPVVQRPPNLLGLRKAHCNSFSCRPAVIVTA